MITQHNTATSTTVLLAQSLPLPVNSTCTSEFNVTVHNDKLLDGTHYTTRNISTSQSLAHSCSDRTKDRTRIVICSGRQHCVAVPFIDELSRSQCCTRHLPTGGVPRNGYFLVLNPNSMPTYASQGSVNPNSMPTYASQGSANPNHINTVHGHSTQLLAHSALSPNQVPNKPPDPVTPRATTTVKDATAQYYCNDNTSSVAPDFYPSSSLSLLPPSSNQPQPKTNASEPDNQDADDSSFSLSASSDDASSIDSDIDPRDNDGNENNPNNGNNNGGNDDGDDGDDDNNDSDGNRSLPYPFNQPPSRPDGPLSPTHHNSFAFCELDSTIIPPSSLMFPDAIAYGINGAIHLRDLPLCVRTSTSIASICLNYIRAPPNIQRRLRDLNAFHLDHTFDTLIAAMDDFETTRDQDVIDCLYNTLSRATNLVTNHLTDQESANMHPTNLPRTFKQLIDNDSSTLLSESCACALIYALKTIFLVHHRNYPSTDTYLPNYYASDLISIARDIPSTAEALHLFSASTSFKTLPWFVHKAFLPLELPDPEDQYLDSPRDDHPFSNLIHVQAESWQIHQHTDPFITSFERNPAETSAFHQYAKFLITLALFHHGKVYHKTQAADDFPFHQNQLIVGNLPPVDQFFSAFASAFPMLTKPTKEQANNPSHIRRWVLLTINIDGITYHEMTSDQEVVNKFSVNITNLLTLQN
jgi:hypothetical protein